MTDELIERIKSEFLEMPGLRLTERQARRLWGLSPAPCAGLLVRLVDSGFLFRTRDGSFMRVERARPVKVAAPPITPLAVNQ